MRQLPISLLGLVAGTVLFASACSDTTQPTPSGQAGSPAPIDAIAQGDDPVALARQVPGFGGFFFDTDGTPTIYLKDARGRAAAEQALRPFLTRQGVSASTLRVRKGDFDWTELERWQERISAEGLALRGAVFVDADERSNRVRVGVERGTGRSPIQGLAARLGVPASAVIVEETDPIVQVATLQSRVRPVRGGLQINFPGFVCTLGFNALRGGQRSFITNSHCTNVQGGVQNTPYWQPTQTVAPTQIATEVADPAYTRPAGCPAGRRCRRSDSARARYAAGTTSTLGSIARTTGPNNNSLTISGNFTITAEGNGVVGQTANKVGRTTGWTRGGITNTCVNTNVAGSNITQLCQSFVSAVSAGGDSGSPVFLRAGGSNNVTLIGILWGGNASGLYVFSPLANVEQELGALTTF
jgi:hypothetical protein